MTQRELEEQILQLIDADDMSRSDLQGVAQALSMSAIPTNGLVIDLSVIGQAMEKAKEGEWYASYGDTLLDMLEEKYELETKLQKFLTTDWN